MKRFILINLLVATFAFPWAAIAQSNASSAEVNDVSITATIRTYVLSAPRANSELVRSFEAGVEESAYGRDADGNWLRILDGWVLGEVFNSIGEIGGLPDTMNSFAGTVTTDTQLYAGPSTRWFEPTGDIEAGTRVLVNGRNEDATWLQVPGGWLDVAHITTDGDVSLLPVAPTRVIITAKTRTFILKEPDLGAEFVDVFEVGEEALATGSNGDGAWFKIGKGWVPAEAVSVSGEIDRLPRDFIGINITIKASRLVSSAPSYRSSMVGKLNKGEESVAIGRSKDGFWLEIGSGWIYIGSPSTKSSYVVADADLMQLPVTEGPAAASGPSHSSSASALTTPTPHSSTLDARTIRTLVSRNTDDIRILDIEFTANATTIEYDLKPWPFVPNKSIAEEVAFKIICAIRNGQQIANTLKFIGHSHFKDDVGRKFTAKSVEMHISARNANRIVCSGNDPSDISWRSLASLYKSYPIPRGAKVDHD